jgi:hypothetical protein
MNAPFKLATAECESFDAVLHGANCWRGQCIQQFADLELTIADALDCLAKAKPTMKIKRGEPIRPAFDELKRLTGAKSAFGKSTRAVAKSLDEIDRLIEWRAHLTHGVLGVWRGNRGQWLLTLQHREPGGDRPVRTYALPRKEADQILERLTEELDMLRARVGSMRGAVVQKAA